MWQAEQGLELAVGGFLLGVSKTAQVQHAENRRTCVRLQAIVLPRTPNAPSIERLG